MTMLAKYSQMLGELAKVPARASVIASRSIKRLIEEQFITGMNPYGGRWAPLRPATLAKGRTPPPLTATGRMRASVRVSPVRGSGIQLSIDELPAGYHQGGTRRMVARPIFPEFSLPNKWRAAIRRAVKEAFK